jgi:hypothetical protein
MRLKFFLDPKFKCRAYVSKNSGTLYWIKPIPSPSRPPASRLHYQWQDWIVYRGRKKIGECRTLADAQLTAQRDHDADQ